MPELRSFEYAVIRVVPQVEREEFMNVGVILYSQSRSFLDAMFMLDEERLRALSPGLEMTEIRKHLAAFCHICKGGPEAGPIGKLDLGFRASRGGQPAKHGVAVFPSTSRSVRRPCPHAQKPAGKTGGAGIITDSGLSESS